MVNPTNTVNPKVVEIAERLSARRILVTGGSGFVGSHLAQTFAAAGHDVLAVGRNPYAVVFAPGGPKFTRVDIRDAAAVAKVCNDKDIVYHCAALATPWGSRESFEAVNVRGTENVLAACEQSGSRLVHVSSTAVQFDFNDATNVVEADGIADANAKPFACEYARSKSLAEDAVRNATNSGLDAVIIRARAIFGPGDNSLLPRLLDAADRGRLRIIGNGENKLDLTFIDNLILALVLSAESGESGGTYTITNDEPVKLWSFIKQTLRDTGRPSELKRVHRGLALFVSGMIERWHRLNRWRNKPNEPSTTRYAVGLLSTTKTFDISLAKNTLGYSPVVNMQAARDLTIKQLQAKDDSPSDVHVGLKLFTTGYTSSKGFLAEKGASKTEVFRFHALIGVIDHPKYGKTLFDAGYAPIFFDATKRFPFRLYRWTTPVVTHDRLSPSRVLLANGIEPSRIERILLSHFHADHTCGLREFPNIDIVCTKRCYEDIRHAKGFSAVKRAFLPDLMPDDLSERVCKLDRFHGPGFGPFDRSHDLFGDGSVRLFDLSGHAPGQIGVLLQRGQNDRVFLTADACWTTKTITEHLPLTFPFRLLADNVAEAKTTVRRLHEFHRAYPDIELIPSHCPEVAKSFGFDRMLEELMPEQRSSKEPAS